MLIKNGKVFADGTFSYHDLRLTGDRIAEILPIDTLPAPGEEVYEAAGGYVVPGFIDLQVHGAVGYDFSDASGEALSAISEHLVRGGVTSYLAASDSFPAEVLEEAFAAAAPLVNQDTGGAVLRGINMTGPFIDPAHHGAQDERYLSKPDLELFERLNALSGNAVKILNISPELPGAKDFIRAAGKSCVVALTHSGANYDVSRMGFAYGARGLSDLYQNMEPMDYGDPGLMGAAVDAAGFVTVQPGRELPHPASLRLAYKVFTDLRMCMVSNSTAFCGLPADVYLIDGHQFTSDGVAARFEDGASAGGVIDLKDCLLLACQLGGIPLPYLIKSVTETPAKVLGVYDELGSITPGKRADVVVMDLHSMRVKAVFLGGNKIV